MDCRKSKTSQDQPLYQEKFLPINNIISLGGLADLRHEEKLIKSSCDRDIPQLAGSASTDRPDIYSDTNAADLIPNGTRTVLITGELDTISPPRVAHDYAAKAVKAGDHAEVLILPGASHYDEIAATSPAWKMVLPVIKQMLGLQGDSL